MERLKQRLVVDYLRRPQDKLVSVIMPTRNRPGTIVDAIKSVVVQSYSNWELVIVDDAGDCNLEMLIASYDDKRIRLVRHNVRRGEGFSRNTGIRNASGTAIVHLDDDDQFDPHLILISLNPMRDADRRMFYCAQTVWQGLEELTMVGKRFLGILYHDFDRERLERSNYLSMSVVMHDRGGRRGLTHLVDWDFFLRMTEVEIPARIPVPLHHYYQARTADSITANNPVEINVTRIRAKLAERLPGTRTAQESKKWRNGTQPATKVRTVMLFKSCSKLSWSRGLSIQVLRQ